MSQYSTYDIDGFPFIPNTDSYMSEECKEIGFAAEREAYADLEFINDFTDSDGKVERITTTPTPVGVGPDSDYGFNNAIEKYYE